MLLDNKTIAVIGAGPVGLTMAKLLLQNGINVKVYERDKDPQARIWGGTLDLHQASGQQALVKAGLLQQYYDKALPMGIVFVDKEAKTIAVREMTPENEHDNPEINRNDLRTLLINHLEPDTVIWDHKLTELETQNGQWQLFFENGTMVKADLVIVANGGRSKIRSYVTDTAVENTGTIIIQGDVSEPGNNCPEFFKLCNGKRLMTADDGTLLVANPFNGGSLSYGVIFQGLPGSLKETCLELNDTAATKKFLLTRLATWDGRFEELIAATTQFVALPTRKLPLKGPWKKDRPLPITLIGDAAHLMPPFAGMGVNTGLVDALILSENLTGYKFETIVAAIEDYERQMFVYAKEAQEQSGKNELEMRSPDFSFEKLLS
ncbi:FAD-dependent monooxygenase [Mucilaginibacter sp. RS28]|uniref:Flavin-dependent monooxygenase n=1 Tax=Mucilaginibacter straminoryzae TaxID=2932774 RepID=A0A9X1X4R1_9SPHI|nr:NAD(P)/FAD-dependent oxidoreductase [Mucilaginibacter straminoryzae]MCJ8210999.1 FAD-dependent monooxygenase [Mucilaginibacter straminoryzae]